MPQFQFDQSAKNKRDELWEKKRQAKLNGGPMPSTSVPPPDNNYFTNQPPKREMNNFSDFESKPQEKFVQSRQDVPAGPPSNFLHG